jgi:catechol 2,3-dioxygenase-like lactoylglutathione lyase family enzyme
MKTPIAGIHHVTAICSDGQSNVNFYAGVLGLRLVKRTVNFDDPGTYHFYYGDGLGHPGTIVTFFNWPGAQRGRIGSGQVTTISFAIRRESVSYWSARLQDSGIPVKSSVARFGDEVITFSDPDGSNIELVATAVTAAEWAYLSGPVPAEHAIRGIHSATLSEHQHQPTSDFLTRNFGFKLLGQEHNRYRYTVGSAEPGSIVDVLDAPNQSAGHISAGTVHHIAWRTCCDQEQAEWLEQLTKQGFSPSPVRDRIYFHSIYFREPGGILFEIATDPPGFTLDESPEHLGMTLCLPPWLEASRKQIEEVLPPLELPAKSPSI